MNQKMLDRRVVRAVHGCRMFQGGDRVAVGVSGGKDSSLLLYTLSRIRDRFKGGVMLKAFRVFDPASPCHQTAEVDAFSRWCGEQNVSLEWIQPVSDPGDSGVDGCFRCAWRRREALFKAAYQQDYRILALGHSAFDVAVTALMNLCLHGKLESMPPVLEMFGGEMSLIRPLAGIPEREILRLHRKHRLPDPPPPCDARIGRTRAHMEHVVRDLIEIRSQTLDNILNAATRWVDPPGRTYD